MPTINEVKKQALNNAGYSGDINTAEYKWLRSAVSPYKGAIPDMWKKYLNNLGYLGPTQTMKNKYFSDLGYTGSFPNKEYQYWKNSGSLGFDFVNNRSFVNLKQGTSLSPLTVTRNSQASYYNSSGVLSFAAVNTARFDYHPITHTPLGLLVEGLITNYCQRSNEFTDAFWGTKTNVTLTPAASLGPDGTMSMTKLEATAAGAANLSTTILSSGSATGNTYSIHIKKGSGAFDCNSFVLRNDTTATNLATVTVNYDTGAIINVTGTGTAAIQALPNGISRLSITATTGISASDNLRIYVGFSGGAETAGEFAYIYGAQVERNSHVSSYIPTAGATANREADVITILTSAFNYSQTVGTVKCEFDVNTLPTPSIFAPVWSFASDGSNRIENYVRHTTGASRFFVRNAGGTQVDLGSATTVVPITFYKSASAWQDNNFGFNLNNSVIETDTSGVVPTATSLTLGGNVVGVSNNIHGHIRTFTYWPVRKTDVELKAMTT